ncbi:MAG: ComF family protein [Paracoccaceae bacterium]
MAQTKIQTALHMLYPPRCLGCGTMVESDFGLCGPCWRDTPFIGTTICDSCGVSLPGDAGPDRLQCDDCLKTARPWGQGRAALLYQDAARKMVLGLKHGDRQEIARPAALWMARAARDILHPKLLIAPIPLHWIRLLKRRFNQSAVLALALADETELSCCPDLLQRTKSTPSLDGMGKDARFAALQNAISVHPKRRHRVVGQHVLLVDDVMTSGATFAAATEASLAAGASDVSVLSLARVAKDA